MTQTRGAMHVADLLLSTATFLFLALLVHFATTTEHSRLEQNLRTHVGRAALDHVSRLESELNANAFLANGMVAHIVTHGGAIEDTVAGALEALLQYGRHIRNIGIAPQNRISHVYPPDGNQAALGLYYPDSPEQWPVIARAIAARKTILAGPVPLRQGGMAVVSRTPVFMPDGSYWGLISMALDMPNLFAAAGLDQVVGDVRYALRGTDGQGATGAVFWGDPALFAEDAVLFDIAVPGGTWQLAAVPTRGWHAETRDVTVLEGAGLVLSALLALLLYDHLRNRRRVVDSEKRLRAFLDTTKDAVIVTGQAGNIQEFNPAAEDMFGFQVDEVMGQPATMLVPADQTDDDAEMGRRRDGGLFPVEVTVGEAQLANACLQVYVIRDITERKAVERRLLELATTDALTGALNRRAFLEAAGNALAIARRYDRPLAFLMLDADHFKRINDTYGHHVGDAILVRLTQVARGCLRTSDIFGRLGGEEFAILLPETDSHHAAEAAERLLAAMRAATVDGDNGHAIRFTVSIGVAALSADCADLAALMRMADTALYRAKAQGRDRWCLNATLAETT